MKHPLVAILEDFQNILGLCPHCGEFFRLTDIAISYQGRPRRTFLDGMEAEEDRLDRAEDRFEERKEEIREAARERGRRQLPRLLKKAEPIFSCRGFFPQDAKALFDPIDFIVFDGMNRKQRIDRVVLLDGPSDGREREKVQRSVERSVHAGNYEWRTVRVGKDGRVESK